MAGKNNVSTDLGLLVIRIGIGVMFVLFGWPKIRGGMPLWEQVGGAMGTYGITAFPAFWGFMAAFSEFAGGLMLILGLLVRPFAALLCFTMVTAAVMLIGQGKEMTLYSHAIDMAIVFLGLVFAGGGRFALGARLPALKDTWFR